MADRTQGITLNIPYLEELKDKIALVSSKGFGIELKN
jgi:hypothetical protein